MARRKGKPQEKQTMFSLIVHSTCGFHSKGDPISGPLLREKALKLHEQLGGSADFKANTGWLKNFKSLLGIRELQIEGESMSGNKNSAHKFKCI
ncbi:jerky-like protein [Trichonephila clavipes]|nr:jerky-like protein [Trichonephila clavipes]